MIVASNGSSPCRYGSWFHLEQYLHHAAQYFSRVFAVVGVVPASIALQADKTSLAAAILKESSVLSRSLSVKVKESEY